MSFIQLIDDNILYFIQNNMVNPVMDKIMPFITGLGNAGILWIVTGIVLLFLKKYRKFGIAMLVSMGLCLVVGNIVLKPLVHRGRPCWVDPSVRMLIPIPMDYSFPSGHSMSSFAGATVLYYANKKWGVVAFILAILIAFSRMYLFVHYPSDVLVGGTIGIILGMLGVKIIGKYIKSGYILSKRF